MCFYGLNPYIDNPTPKKACFPIPAISERPKIVFLKDSMLWDDVSPSFFTSLSVYSRRLTCLLCIIQISTIWCYALSHRKDGHTFQKLMQNAMKEKMIIANIIWFILLIQRLEFQNHFKRSKDQIIIRMLSLDLVQASISKMVHYSHPSAKDTWE